MRDTIVIFVASCIWIAAFYRFRVWRRASQKELSLAFRLKYIWYFYLFLACAVTLFYDKVTVRVDTLIGLNNFSWLAAYLSGLTAFYAYNLFVYNTIHLSIRIKSRILDSLKKILLISYVALIAVYWFAIRLSPEWPSRLPRSGEDVLFQNLFFSVATIFTLTIAWRTYLFVKQESNRFFKLQGALSLLTIMAGATCFVFKILFVSLWFVLPNEPALLSLNQFALLAMGVAGLLCLLNNTVVPLTRTALHFADALQKVPALVDLLELQNKLHHHRLIAEPTSISVLQYLAEPDYYLLKIIVSVLDTKRRQEAIQADSSLVKRKLQEAIRDLDPQAEYQTLVTACRRINRSLQTTLTSA